MYPLPLMVRWPYFWSVLALLAAVAAPLPPLQAQSVPPNREEASNPSSGPQAVAAVPPAAVTPEAVPPAAVASEKVEDRRSATLLRLQLPITGSADQAFRQIVDRTRQRLQEEADPADERPVIVIEFTPLAEGEGFGEGSDFTRALSLARYLVSDDLAGVKTIAYLPRTIKGHAVLVALACEEIAMAPTAELGEAGLDEDPSRPIDPTIMAGYQQVARARRTAPVAIAVGMLDPSLEVLEVETETSIEFVTREELSELEQEQTVVSATPLFPQGSMGILSGREARKFGVVKYVANDRDALAQLLRLESSSLSEAGRLVADWKPLFYTIDGPISAADVSRARRLLEQEISTTGANWIGFRITSSGGNPVYGQQLASYVASLGSDQIRTVAYIPNEAQGGAALVALSCDQLVMHRTATLSGEVAPPQPPGPDQEDTPRPELGSLKMAIEESLAGNTPHTASLLIATIDPEAEVYRYTHRQTGEEQLFSPEQARQQPDAAQWRQGEAITTVGEVLQLDSDAAIRLGVATHVVDNIEELKQLYGFTSDPREVKSNWSFELAEALASPGVTVLLLVIAFAGIYFELHTPGLGIGGFVAALALLLFFWSKALHGTVEWLEVLLFVAGVLSILMEIFVVPGVGIFGLGGALLVISSLVLAGQRSLVPRSAEDFAELQQSLSVVALAGILMILTTAILRRYLPRIPFLKTLMLAPMPAEELAELTHRESLAEYAHLVGERGTTTTPLMPSGRAEIAGELVDVISQGESIDRGTLVEVIRAYGSRVIVQAVK